MLNTEILAKFVPLNLINQQFLADIAKFARPQTAQKGTIIFKRGKILSEYYFLVRGDVDLISSDYNVEKIQSGSERSFHSLNLNSPTVVSGIAKSPVTFFTIDAHLVDKTIANMHRSVTAESKDENYAIDVGMEVGEIHDAGDWMSCLLQSPIFSRIPITQLQELFGKFEKVYARKGERIVNEGASGDYFYVLASGSAIVSNRSGSVDLELKEGDYFGEEALISNAPRNASIYMTSDGMLKRLNADDFSALVKEPVLRYVSMDELADQKKPLKILDVRLPIEYRAGHYPASINVPLSKLRDSIRELGRGFLYAVSGEAGARADIATYILCQGGFDVVILKTELQELDQSISRVS